MSLAISTISIKIHSKDVNILTEIRNHFSDFAGRIILLPKADEGKLKLFNHCVCQFKKCKKNFTCYSHPNIPLLKKFSKQVSWANNIADVDGVLRAKWSKDRLQKGMGMATGSTLQFLSCCCQCSESSPTYYRIL